MRSEKLVIAAPITGANEQNANRLSLAAVAIAIWLLVCVILTLRWGWATLALRRTLASCEPLLPICGTVEACLDQLKSTPSCSYAMRSESARPRASYLWIVPSDDSTPQAIGKRTTTDQLRSIVLHEYQHIRRFDVLLLILSRCVKTIYWFNPSAYIVSKILRREMELAVDAATIGSLKFCSSGRVGYLLLLH